MAPTQSTVVTTPISTHRVSIPAMVVLGFLLAMMAALAIGVILRQRQAMAALKSNGKILHEAPPSARANWSWASRFKPSPRSTADNLTAVGALHAASALLAAAPCQVFSSPMTMHFRIPLEDKTILILGAPWLTMRCGAQCCAAPAVPVRMQLLGKQL